MKIGLRKRNFIGVKKFFSEILIEYLGVEMNFRIITKNRAGDPEIGFLAKSILKSYDCAVAIPTV